MAKSSDVRAEQSAVFSARWKKVLHDVLGSKTRTVLIVLSMAVGLFAVGIIVSARTILSEGLARSFAAIRPSSGTIRTSQLFDEDFVTSVRAMPDVVDVGARRSISARVQTAPDRWTNITLFVLEDYYDIQVNKVSAEEGAWPPPDREILIERAALPVINAEVGATLLFRMPDEAERRMRIAGTAHDPAQMPAQLDDTPYGYITFETLEWLGQPYGFNELHVVTTDSGNKAWAEQVINQVKNKAERSGYTIPLSMTADPGQLPMDDVLQGILLLMGVLGVMSLILSAFLVVNTVSALLAQQRRQIGVMKAIGGSSLQLLGMYLAMVISYGLLALLIAIPLGIYGAQALSRSLATFFNFDLLTMDPTPQALLFQVLIGLALPVVASLLPFLSSLRISAAEAISANSAGRRRFRTHWIGWLISGQNLWFVRRLPVRDLLLSIRNMFRNQGRLALTLATLTLGSATFMSVFNVRASLTRTVDDMMAWFNTDLLFTFERPYRSERISQEAFRVPGVTDTDVWLHLPARRVRPDDSESAMMYMFAPTISDRSQIKSPTMVEGRWLLPNDENAVVVPSALFNTEPDLRLGDEIVLKINGQERPLRIVGTYVGSSFAAMIFANYSYIARVTNRVGETNALMVQTERHDAASVEAWSNALEEHLDARGVQVGTVSSMQSEREDAEVIFDSIVALLLVMAVLLALVGGLGLMGTMSINVLERTREIGVLRAIGAPNRAVAQVFIREGIAIGVLSWLMGAVLAIPMSQALNQAAGAAMMGMPLSYSYSMSGLWSWLVAVIVLSALASFIPARNATRLTVREVLAYE
jgi:putative ABC transport system permease protein